MEPIFLVLILSATFSILGVWIRIGIQRKRDKEWPWGNDWQLGPITETFIGFGAGVILWLISLIASTPETWLQPVLYVGCVALGFAGTDAIENLLTEYTP